MYNMLSMSDSAVCTTTTYCPRRTVLYVQLQHTVHVGPCCMYNYNILSTSDRAVCTTTTYCPRRTAVCTTTTYCPRRTVMSSGEDTTPYGRSFFVHSQQDWMKSRAVCSHTLTPFLSLSSQAVAPPAVPVPQVAVAFRPQIP